VSLNTPRHAGFFQPAEWDRHESCWLAWPSHADLWQEDLPAAQAEFTALAKAITDVDPLTGEARGEKLNVLVMNDGRAAAAKEALEGLPVELHPISFGDIWLRDTAPIFLKRKDGGRATARFVFNGWGGKYVLPTDDKVAARIAGAASLTEFDFPFVLEGGSVEVDGAGTCLTTKQCLLNPNRNPGMSLEDLEGALRESLGVSKILWLGDGLINDHTDGHIDTIARFSPPGVALCMKAVTSADPNAERLAKIESDLRSFTDAAGRRLNVITIPSPGEILDEDGDLMPASYLNFYIGNTTVAVPTYGSPQDAAAVAMIAKCFPGRHTVGLSAKTILSGGGAFHCITQQVPL
jgi:agmatine deiminase